MKKEIKEIILLANKLTVAKKNTASGYK